MNELTAYKTYVAMLSVAIRLGLPRYYQNDLLVHDLERLLEWKGGKFYWVLRESGTFFLENNPGRYTGGDPVAYLYEVDPSNASLTLLDSYKTSKD